MSAVGVLLPVSPIQWRAAASRSTHLATKLLGPRWPPCLEDAFWLERKRANAKRRRASIALAATLVVLFGFVDGYIAPAARTSLWLIRFGIFTPVALALLAMTIWHPEHKWSEFAVMLGVFVAGACLTAMTLIAPEHHAGVLLLVFAAYTLLGLRCVHASGAAMAVTVLYAVSAVVDGRTPWPVTATNMLFLLGCNVIGAFVCYVLEQAARREFRHGRALSEERQRSENLLCNVLPTPVAQRLKSHSGAIADAHPDVTILFADIVDFTAYAAAVAPARLVQLLDDIFTRFDALAQKHGLEKIKTIGDAYMVAGGLSTHGFDHVRAIADLALEMLDSIRSVDAGDGRTLALRIGINTGPVVAGVIGKTKFAYDLWGDTVNVASRLESFAQPGTIQVSQSTYDRLRDYYAFSPRHHIRVKGRGELPCYLLLSRTATADLGAAKAVSTRASPVLDAVSSGSCAVD